MRLHELGELLGSSCVTSTSLRLTACAYASPPCHPHSLFPQRVQGLRRRRRARWHRLQAQVKGQLVQAKGSSLREHRVLTHDYKYTVLVPVELEYSFTPPGTPNFLGSAIWLSDGASGITPTPKVSQRRPTKTHSAGHRRCRERGNCGTATESAKRAVQRGGLRLRHWQRHAGSQPAAR